MGMTISPSRHTMSAIQPELADGGTGCEGLITTLYLDGLDHVLPWQRVSHSVEVFWSLEISLRNSYYYISPSSKFFICLIVKNLSFDFLPAPCTLLANCTVSKCWKWDFLYLNFAVGNSGEIYTFQQVSIDYFLPIPNETQGLVYLNTDDTVLSSWRFFELSLTRVKTEEFTSAVQCT